MKLTKQQLQTIIREEYVKVLFEARGQRISNNHAKVLVESLDEGFFDSLTKGLKAGKEAFSAAKSQEKEKRLDDARAKLASAEQDLHDQFEDEIELVMKNSLAPLRMKAKNQVQKMVGLDAKEMAEDYDEEDIFASKATNLWDDALFTAKKPNFSGGEPIGARVAAPSLSTRGTRFVGSGGRR